MYMAYQTQKLSDHLYLIEENLSGGQFPVRMFLVVGEKRAALIDTGLGTGDLKKEVASITDLPVLVLHTHGHIDHTGADSQFENVFLHEEELPFFAGEVELRKADEQRRALIRIQLGDSFPLYSDDPVAHRDKPSVIRYQKIADGDRFDLGNVELQVIATPGHTTGSLSFVNRRDGYAFTGDGIADIHWFDNPTGMYIEDFLQMLHHFEGNAGPLDCIYAAHLSDAFDMGLLHDLQQAAEEILQGASDSFEMADYQFLRHGRLYAHRAGSATLYYDKAHIQTPEMNGERA